MYMQAYYQLRKDELEAAQAEAWLLSLLSDEARGKVLRVASVGLGVCSRCHFMSGCASCDYDKALRFWLCKENWVKRTW